MCSSPGRPRCRWVGQVAAASGGGCLRCPPACCCRPCPSLPFPALWPHQSLRVGSVARAWGAPAAGGSPLTSRPPPPPQLFLPHASDAGTVQRVLLREGAAVMVRGARSVRLRRGLDLPPIGLSEFAGIVAADAGQRQPLGVLHLLAGVRAAAAAHWNASHPDQSLGLVGLELDLSPHGAALLAAPAATTTTGGGGSGQRLRVRPVKPGVIELVARDAPPQGGEAARGAVAVPSAVPPSPTWPLASVHPMQLQVRRGAGLCCAGPRARSCLARCFTLQAAELAVSHACDKQPGRALQRTAPQEAEAAPAQRPAPLQSYERLLRQVISSRLFRAPKGQQQAFRVAQDVSLRLLETEAQATTLLQLRLELERRPRKKAAGAAAGAAAAPAGRRRQQQQEQQQAVAVAVADDEPPDAHQVLAAAAGRLGPHETWRATVQVRGDAQRGTLRFVPLHLERVGASHDTVKFAQEALNSLYGMNRSEVVAQ